MNLFLVINFAGAIQLIYNIVDIKNKRHYSVVGYLNEQLLSV